MRHPPYDLRPNKAIDRYLLLESLRRLEGCGLRLSEYTYYGMGGPFLEDFKLLNRFFPQIGLISIEEDEQTYLRQEFNRFTSRIDLKKEELGVFLNSEYDSEGKEAVWLDYCDLKYPRLQEFQKLLELSAAGSIVKITLRANAQDFTACLQLLEGRLRDLAEKGLLSDFYEQFERMLPRPPKVSDFRMNRFPELVQGMVQIAAEQMLPASKSLRFQPICSCFYRDSVTMLTVTGVVCDDRLSTQIKESFGDWPLGNLDWTAPKAVEVPALSIRERLHLEKLLPLAEDGEDGFAKALGYLIDGSKEKSKQALLQYSKLHSYFPQFAKVSL